jgi:hypothetical protein
MKVSFLGSSSWLMIYASPSLLGDALESPFATQFVTNMILHKVRVKQGCDDRNGHSAAKKRLMDDEEKGCCRLYTKYQGAWVLPMSFVFAARLQSFSIVPFV